jgi:hypothetical protein
MKGDTVDFLKILNAAFAVIAWFIVLAIIWALGPYALKMLHFVQSVHDLGK